MKRERRSDMYGYVWEKLAHSCGYAMIRRINTTNTPLVVILSHFKTWQLVRSRAEAVRARLTAPKWKF